MSWRVALVITSSSSSSASSQNGGLDRSSTKKEKRHCLHSRLLNKDPGDASGHNHYSSVQITPHPRLQITPAFPSFGILKSMFVFGSNIIMMEFLPWHLKILVCYEPWEARSPSWRGVRISWDIFLKALGEYFWLLAITIQLSLSSKTLQFTCGLGRYR